MRSYITTEIINGKPTVVTNHIGDAAVGVTGVDMGVDGGVFTLVGPQRRMYKLQDMNFSPWKIIKALFTDKI